MKCTFYDILKDILLKQNGNLDKEKCFETEFSKYMMIRYLSMKTDLMCYANKLNKYQSVLTNKEVYKWLYNIIPKQTSGYIAYIKKDKKKNPNK